MFISSSFNVPSSKRLADGVSVGESKERPFSERSPIAVRWYEAESLEKIGMKKNSLALFIASEFGGVNYLICGSGCSAGSIAAAPQIKLGSQKRVTNGERYDDLRKGSTHSAPPTITEVRPRISSRTTLSTYVDAARVAVATRFD